MKIRKTAPGFATCQTRLSICLLFETRLQSDAF
jgi:hypothetical protein